jgi:hypothetical protein
VARQFHLPEEQLRNRLTAIRREAARPQSPKLREGAAATSPNPNANTSATEAAKRLRPADLPAWERELLELLLLEPSFLSRINHVVRPEAITSEAVGRIFTLCCQLARDGRSCAFADLLAALDDPDLQGLLVGLDESCANKATADRERWLADLLHTYRRRGEEAQRRRVLAAARGDASDAEQLLAQFCEQSKSKHLSDYERRKK